MLVIEREFTFREPIFLFPYFKRNKNPQQNPSYATLLTAAMSQWSVQALLKQLLQPRVDNDNDTPVR
jgi:hypothetical protein